MDNKIPHILIVDDDANLLTTMSDILKMKGFEPFIAPDGAAALAQLEKHILIWRWLTCVLRICRG